MTNNFDSSTYVFELPPPAPIATHILAHPAAKYLFIQVCPKFAISHFAVHHVIFEKASADMVGQVPKRPFYSPCKLRADIQQIAIGSGHTRTSRYICTIYLQVKQSTTLKHNQATKVFTW